MNDALKDGKPKPTRRMMRLIGCNLLTTAALLIAIELGLRLFDYEFGLAPPRIEFGWPAPKMMGGFVVDPEVEDLQQPTHSSL